MPRRIIVEVVCFAAALAMIGGAIYAERVTTTAAVEVTVWKHATTGNIYLSTRPADGTWTTHNTAVDFSTLHSSGQFYQGSAVTVQVPVTLDLPDVPDPGAAGQTTEPDPVPGQGTTTAPTRITDPEDNQPNDITAIEIAPSTETVGVRIELGSYFSDLEKWTGDSNYLTLSFDLDGDGAPDLHLSIDETQVVIYERTNDADGWLQDLNRLGTATVTATDRHGRPYLRDTLEFSLPRRHFGDATQAGLEATGAWARSSPVDCSYGYCSWYTYDRVPEIGEPLPVIPLQ